MTPALTDPAALAERSAERFRQSDFMAALGFLDAAIASSARDPALHSNRSLVLQRLGRVVEAVEAGRLAVTFGPSMPAAHANLGGALRLAHQFDEALAALDRALQLEPAFADAHAQRGLILQELGQPTQAIEAHRQALTLAPDLPEAWSNIGNCLQASADVGGAKAAYRRALAARPGFMPAISNLQMCAQYDPSMSAAELRSLAGEWQPAWDMSGHARTTRLARRAGAARPLRIGYVSADFYEHPVGWFICDVLRKHDPARVDVHCYASQAIRDAMTEKLIAAVPHWAFVGELGDEALAERIRADRIDVLVDLSGHTSGNRLGVFARRCAPTQVSWLGYFASTGLREMDAVLLGNGQVAPGCQEYFTERLVPLDCCQFAYTAPESAPLPVAPDRREPVFGSFNNLAKVNDEVLEAWCAILRTLPTSRLVLKWNSLNDPWVQESLRRRAYSHGVAPHRLEFRGPVPHRDMLEEYADIDVALDPFPFSGALTTIEALWMGVPVVTLEWHRPVSRQSASILRTLGLDSLVASTPRDYVAAAVGLARDREKLLALRTTMRESIRSSALADGRRVAAELERAFETLHGRPA